MWEYISFIWTIKHKASYHLDIFNLSRFWSIFLDSVCQMSAKKKLHHEFRKMMILDIILNIWGTFLIVLISLVQIQMIRLVIMILMIMMFMNLDLILSKEHSSLTAFTASSMIPLEMLTMYSWHKLLGLVRFFVFSYPDGHSLSHRLLLTPLFNYSYQKSAK